MTKRTVATNGEADRATIGSVEHLRGMRRAVESLADSTSELDERTPGSSTLATVTERGHFRPDEEASLLAWFARFLTVRNGLWEVLGEVSAPVRGSVHRIL
ncbi:MAG: hypothetical protein GY906_03040, partial [bacterium]|nr:hypothetical protein [bacterium]